jgi:2-amino-4-hydroxy-6-hydroxymethyldihydropteridine diphosphokinase
MAIVYVGIGSNLGDRRNNLKKAIRYLTAHQSIKILKKSSIQETDPIGYINQPRFLNQVLAIETSETPHDLLQIFKQIEIKLGRIKSFPKGPRTIDLDILLYNNIILNTIDLIIPHPEIKNRNFILQHLIELEPDLIDPMTGKSYRES